jgi:hypothetical protein
MAQNVLGKKISIYTQIAREIEREQTYIAMCKSFPSVHMDKINVNDIMIHCKNSEHTSVDIIIPNWNDHKVEEQLRLIISTKTTGIVITRLLSNLRERLSRFLQNIHTVDIPAIRPTIYFNPSKKIYKISLMYSFMMVEQTISQRLYTMIQKRVGSCADLMLICFWISLRYSILYPRLGAREAAIEVSCPAFLDISQLPYRKRY